MKSTHTHTHKLLLLFNTSNNLLNKDGPGERDRRMHTLNTYLLFNNNIIIFDKMPQLHKAFMCRQE